MFAYHHPATAAAGALLIAASVVSPIPAIAGAPVSALKATTRSVVATPPGRAAALRIPRNGLADLSTAIAAQLRARNLVVAAPAARPLLSARA